MVDLPQKKVGIVACSGEELAEGTITRLAALRVLEKLRPDVTVTICLPLFLAGGEGDRAFARFYPTIAVDGCDLRCAERATEKYSNKPAASIRVDEIIKDEGLPRPMGRRKLDEAGLQAVELTAKQISNAVDGLLGQTWDRRQGAPVEDEMGMVEAVDSETKAAGASCACGSGIPVQKIKIGGEEITLVGIPLIFQQFMEAGKNPTEILIAELMEMVSIYNPIPADEAMAYEDGIRKAYLDYWLKEGAK
jgi:uncharacterized metal-binding protein